MDNRDYSIFKRGGNVCQTEKLHVKTVYILAWVILVCAGILIRTGIADDVWKLVYRGIYGSSSGDAGGSI